MIARLMRICVGLNLALSAAASASAEEPPARGAGQYDLVVTAGTARIVLRFEITADGKPWRAQFDDLQKRYRRAIFKQLDSDRDGALSPAEARRLPPPRAWSSVGAGEDVHVAFNFRVLDADGDGSASPAEFEVYAAAFGNVPLRMLVVPAGRSGDDLFRALDTNRDRMLTQAEWSAAGKLFEKDRDGDRVLTADELRGPAPIAMPPEFVASVAGSRGPAAPLTIAMKPAEEAAADGAVLVEYFDAVDGAQRPRMTVRLAPTAARQNMALESSEPGEVVLQLNGRRVVLRVSPPAVRSAAAMRQQLLEQFDALAEGSEPHVAAATSMPAPLKAVFGIADANDDGQLDRPELLRCVENLLPLQMAAESAGLRFVQFAERSGLMPIVDGNLDGRFSRREVQELPRRLAAIVGPAGRLERDQVPRTLVVVLQHGPFGDAGEPNVLENIGPPWFFRADRNHDGDLDREEFLGSPEIFRRLDVNGDGWIDVEEAILGDTVGADVRENAKK